MFDDMTDEQKEELRIQIERSLASGISSLTHEEFIAELKEIANNVSEKPA